MPRPLVESLALLPSPLTSLVVGGTSGIGSGVAIALAQHTNSASQVIIAGRREDAGQEVCKAAKAKVISRDAKAKDPVTFKKVDASMMKNIKTFCSQLKTDLNAESSRKLDVLVLSQGVLNFSRKDTAEGIESVIALNYYGRMYFIRELNALGLLSPQCLVINVLNGKVGDPSGKTIDFEDMDMRRTGIMASIKQNMAMSDIMIQDLGVEQQQDGERRAFIHDYPGFVKTDLMKNPILKTIFSITEYFMRRSISTEIAGERIVAGSVACLLNTRDGQKGYWYIDDHGEEIVKTVTDEEVRVKVREHTWDIVDQALGDGVKHA